jgi:hypothetical protein
VEEQSNETHEGRKGPRLGRGCLIGCLILVGVIVIGIILVVSQYDRLLGLMITRLENMVVRYLPEGYDTERVHVGFDQLEQGLEVGTVNEQELQQVLAIVSDALRDRKLTEVELEQMLSLMEAAYRE